MLFSISLGNAVGILGQGCRVAVFQNSRDFGENSGPSTCRLQRCPQQQQERSSLVQSPAQQPPSYHPEGGRDALETSQKRQLPGRAPGAEGVRGSPAPALLWRLAIEKSVQLYLNTLS